jgi:hypothetical protein
LAAAHSKVINQMPWPTLKPKMSDFDRRELDDQLQTQEMVAAFVASREAAKARLRAQLSELQRRPEMHPITTREFSQFVEIAVSTVIILSSISNVIVASSMIRLLLKLAFPSSFDSPILLIMKGIYCSRFLAMIFAPSLLGSF